MPEASLKPDVSIVRKHGKRELHHLLEVHLGLSRCLLRVVWLSRHDCGLAVLVAVLPMLQVISGGWTRCREGVKVGNAVKLARALLVQVA